MIETGHGEGGTLVVRPTPELRFEFFGDALAITVRLGHLQHSRTFTYRHMPTTLFAGHLNGGTMKYEKDEEKGIETVTLKGGDGFNMEPPAKSITTYDIEPDHGVAIPVRMPVGTYIFDVAATPGSPRLRLVGSGLWPAAGVKCEYRVYRTYKGGDTLDVGHGRLRYIGQAEAGYPGDDRTWFVFEEVA